MIGPIARKRHSAPPVHPQVRPADVVVRPYRPRDFDSLYHICAETALMGRPQEMTAEARRVLIHAIIGYYPRYEPACAWVAEVKGETVGYIVGALDNRRHSRFQKQCILPGAARACLRGQFALSRKNGRMALALMRSAMRREFNEPNHSDEYPAHLHTNLLEGYRGWGLGRKLMDAYLEYLTERGVPGVCLGTTSYNKQALAFYERNGFREIWRSPTTMFRGIIPEDVYLLTLARRLR